jgi:hypothetical protein
MSSRGCRHRHGYALAFRSALTARPETHDERGASFFFHCVKKSSHRLNIPRTQTYRQRRYAPTSLHRAFVACVITRQQRAEENFCAPRAHVALTVQFAFTLYWLGVDSVPFRAVTFSPRQQKECGYRRSHCTGTGANPLCSWAPVIIIVAIRQ